MKEDLEDKVISADSSPCPAGKPGVVTTIVYESGKTEYKCSKGSTHSGGSACEAGLEDDRGYFYCPCC